jgi:hypothetical protein
MESGSDVRAPSKSLIEILIGDFDDSASASLTADQGLIRSSLGRRTPEGGLFGPPSHFGRIGNQSDQ